jgi:hypothetical protein
VQGVVYALSALGIGESNNLDVGCYTIMEVGTDLMTTYNTLIAYTNPTLVNAYPGLNGCDQCSIIIDGTPVPTLSNTPTHTTSVTGTATGTPAGTPASTPASTGTPTATPTYSPTPSITQSFNSDLWILQKCSDNLLNNEDNKYKFDFITYPLQLNKIYMVTFDNHTQDCYKVIKQNMEDINAVQAYNLIVGSGPYDTCIECGS